jgi:CheY-like chemotaxis protein
MTFMLLRQNAAESCSVSGCGLCGALSPGGARDHLLVGQPGTPSADMGLCPSCGDVLVHLTNRFGGEFSMKVDAAPGTEQRTTHSLRPRMAASELAADIQRQLTQEADALSGAGSRLQELAHNLEQLPDQANRVAEVEVGVKHIALVADDPTTRRTDAEALLARKYHVDSYPEPEAASEAIRQALPDLVILDLSEAAHRRSWRVLRLLKQQRETSAIPVLVSSAAAPALRRDADTLAEYGVHVLAQPMVANELLGWTQQVLHRDA